MVKRDNGTTRRSGTTTTNASGATTVSKEQPAAAAALGKTAGRSGGVVDAPGKRHRKPMPTDPGANIADSQAAKIEWRRRWSRRTGAAGAGS
jgi:hypothetical protein